VGFLGNRHERAFLAAAIIVGAAISENRAVILERWRGEEELKAGEIHQAMAFVRADEEIGRLSSTIRDADAQIARSQHRALLKSRVDWQPLRRLSCLAGALGPAHALERADFQCAQVERQSAGNARPAQVSCVAARRAGHLETLQERDRT
jgi:hypothetical protein